MTTKSQNLYVKILRYHGLDAAAEQLTDLLRLYSVRTKRRYECRRLENPWLTPQPRHTGDPDRDRHNLDQQARNRVAAGRALAEVDAQIAALEAALTGGSDD